MLCVRRYLLVKMELKYTKRIGKTERGQFVIVPHVVKGKKIKFI